MISAELQKAREYENGGASPVPAEARPAYHFSPRVGWLNDPNGLSYYNGEYHLFYQYHPYNTYWGPMHWGHAVSRDMISWEYRPCAMAPDKDYDKSGCFSGSAITLEDGRHLLIYTGCGDSSGDPTGKGRWLQLQSLAVLGEDGEYVKHDKNPVITVEDMPEGTDPYEFRDPFIWRAADGSYRAVAAAGRAPDPYAEGTQLLMFRSADGFDWCFDKVLFEDSRRIGVMWECPNYFPLDGRQVLIASPMDMKAEEEEAVGSVRFPQGNNVCYITGRTDAASENFIPDTDADGNFIYEPVDCGLDFYAPQVMETPDGRRVMIGWMQDPKPANLEVNGRRDSGIFGQMTIPRELSLRDGKLIQLPVKELEAYREEQASHKDVELAQSWTSIPGIGGRVLDMELEIRTEAGCKGAGVRFAADDEHYVELWYDPQRSVIRVDRSQSIPSADIPASRTVRVRDRQGVITLRLLLDRWSAEVFVNDGEQVMSVMYYTDLTAQDILFKSEGSSSMNVSSRTLNVR